MKTLAVCVVLALSSLLFVTFANGTDDGKALFESKCAMCHGKDGVAKSMAKGSANFNDPKWQQATAGDAISKIIIEGKNKMKGLKDKLTPEQVKAIAAYVKTIK